MVTVEAFDDGGGHEVLGGGALVSPIVLNSPHSGSHYPQSFLSQSRLDAMALRRSEDAFVDELFAPCVSLGAPLLRARFPRAYVDVNREPFELDPHMFSDRLPPYANTRSLRVAGGLGTIPRLVGDAQPIYRGAIPADEALSRIARCYLPYHAELTRLVERASVVNGVAVLLDCHSMPASAVENAPADFIVGDRFGSSAASWISELLVATLESLGYVVRRNKPYAGGFITEHYGQPERGRHALQIEVNRSLYIDERTLERRPRFAILQRHLLTLVSSLAKELTLRQAPRAIAAE
jgi:N-formylglutamate amidohydrolase